MKDVSEWTIWIDDLQGELAMKKTINAVATRDVVDRDELVEFMKNLIGHAKAKIQFPYKDCPELEQLIKEVEAFVAQ